MSTAKHTDSVTYPTPWQIVRNHKEHFAVARNVGPMVREYVTSASGRPSSFKTYKGAQRALWGARAKAIEVVEAASLAEVLP